MAARPSRSLTSTANWYCALGRPLGALGLRRDALRALRARVRLT